MLKSESKLDMTFASFVEIFEEDRKKRIKENTWATKSHIIRTKILPYFGERKIGDIEPKDVIAWQNELLDYRDENGEGYAAGYLKTIHAQLSAIFNHAVRYYHLPFNPASRVGGMGGEDHKEMQYWTKEEYLKFADVMMDKPVSYYAFEVLYWMGIRCGELLALTPADFNFERQELTIRL
jgi:integrase